MKLASRKLLVTLLSMLSAVVLGCTVGLTDQMVTVLLGLTGMYLAGNSLSKIVTSQTGNVIRGATKSALSTSNPEDVPPPVEEDDPQLDLPI